MTVRVRLFNTYWPGEYFTPFRSAICRFAYSALLGLPYTVYLNHRRTSIFISDAVRTLAAIATGFVPGEVYNLGGSESHDMKAVSDTILGLLGKDDALVTSDALHSRDRRRFDNQLECIRGHEPVEAQREGLSQLHLDGLMSSA